MRVKLKQNWFGPNAHLYERAEFGATEIPDDFRDVLPPGSVVLGDNDKPEQAPVPVVQSFRDFDDNASILAADAARLVKIEDGRLTLRKK